MASKRFLIQDIIVDDVAAYVVGVLNVHKTNVTGDLEYQGVCLVRCALATGNSVSASCFLGENTLPELTDEEWETVYDMMRAYTMATLHKTELIVWRTDSQKDEENNPKPNKFRSHYDWLEKHLPEIFRKAGIEWAPNAGIIGAHGDKAYGYQDRWEKAGIHFYHGVALYLMTYCQPYSQTCRETLNDWVDPGQWVINNYKKLKHLLPAVEA
jgi:hypothetical protein